MRHLVQLIRRLQAWYRSFSVRSTEEELLDEALDDADELAVNLRDMRRVNRLLGGTPIILRHLPRLLPTAQGAEPLTILDLATGSGDIPLAVSRWAKRRGLPVQITASDVSPEILAVARREVGQHPSITIEQYDARAVPLPDKQFDIVLCSLSLHHLDPDDATQVLREMDRLSRRGLILNDLYRSRLGFIAAWVAARLTSRNRLSHNDAPLSIRRAYTPQELDGMLRRAGIEDASISTHLWFRMAAVKPRVNPE